MFDRRSEQESQWLRDLSIRVVMANPKPEDPIFTRRVAKTPGGRVFTKKLTTMMIREAVKDMAVKAGLPADRFSSHSLRKGGVTQMSALGASSEDKRDRGNYADESTVFDTVYDYSNVGLGPLACNANLGTGNAEKPTVEHVSRGDENQGESLRGVWVEGGPRLVTWVSPTGTSRVIRANLSSTNSRVTKSDEGYDSLLTNLCVPKGECELGEGVCGGSYQVEEDESKWNCV